VPVGLTIRQLVVEAIKNPGNEKTYLGVSQVLTDAIACPMAERLEHGTIVEIEPGIVTCIGMGQPTFGLERVYIGEVLGVAECRPLVNGDDSLL
jgi:hypothetical protein